MAEKTKNTEAKILEAAKTIFIEEGYIGSSMQQIADEAGINKALLHYYYRNKEKLFHAAFAAIFETYIPKAQEIFDSDLSFFDKIRQFVSTYIDLLLTNPMVPIFILQEINRNPDLLVELITKNGTFPMSFIKLLAEEVDKGNIEFIDPRQLLVNILSLCILPIAARPLLKRVIFFNDDVSYDEFLEERKTEVANFVIKSISKR
jgi:TetR/AcrR family transcriptional regulator